MALVFTFVRTKAGVVADLNPNDAPPAQSDVFVITQRRHSFGGRDPTRGYIYYLVFLGAGGAEVPGGKADVTPWLKDEALPNSWAAAAQDKATKHRTAITNLQHWINDASVFFQLTGITGAGVVTIEVRAEAV